MARRPRRAATEETAASDHSSQVTMAASATSPRRSATEGKSLCASVVSAIRWVSTYFACQPGASGAIRVTSYRAAREASAYSRYWRMRLPTRMTRGRSVVMTDTVCVPFRCGAVRGAGVRQAVRVVRGPVVRVVRVRPGARTGYVSRGVQVSRKPCAEASMASSTAAVDGPRKRKRVPTCSYPLIGGTRWPTGTCSTAYGMRSPAGGAVQSARSTRQGAGTGSGRSR